jgi:beta-phosphoglucomutase
MLAALFARNVLLRFGRQPVAGMPRRVILTAGLAGCIAAYWHETVRVEKRAISYYVNNGESTQRAISQIQALDVRPRPHAFVVFLNGPFPNDYDTMFIAALVWKDPSIDIWLQYLHPLPKDELVHASYIFDYVDGRFVIAKTPSGCIAAFCAVLHNVEMQVCGAVLWDLDGTLVDSEEYHWRAWKETLDREGVSITRQDFLASFGQRNDAILGKWLGKDADAGTIQRIGDAKEVRYRELVRLEGLAPLPGAAEWVERLHSDGWLQAIASSAPRLNVEAVLEALHFRERIQATASAEDVSAGKPDPQVFLVAAARLGATPETCIVVEDARAGVEAARRAGMRSIGVGKNAGLLGADLSAARLSDLPSDVFSSLLANWRLGT